MNRDETLERVRNRTQPWDIIVIGGGATGVGCAIDARSRGLDVLLLEQHDFGKGTSSRSTKLVHGGVRYLAQGNISLIRKALKERAILLRNAPHVVHKQAFIVPCYSLWQKLFYGTGLKLYDLLSGKDNLGKSQILSKSETIKRLPTLKTTGLGGGILYFDGQFDDTRLLIDLVTTAHNSGADIINYAKVNGYLRSKSGRITGVSFTEQESQEKFNVSSTCVINATGIFCDELRTESDVKSRPIVTLSQGIHLVFERRFLPCDYALMIPKTSDGRVLFCIPWLGHTLVGTTDTPIGEASLEPQALESEVEFVLTTLAKYLNNKPTRQDVLSVFAGIRPLVRSPSTNNVARLARDHIIETSEAGLVTITGGKWTTYRCMAEDVVSHAMKINGLTGLPSRTENLRIAGPAANMSADTTRLHPHLPYVREDVIRAVRTEMAQTVEDVLARRTRALFLDAKAAIEMAPTVAAIMMEELGKNGDWKEKQVTDFLAVAEAYNLS